MRLLKETLNDILQGELCAERIRQKSNAVWQYDNISLTPLCSQLLIYLIGVFGACLRGCPAGISASIVAHLAFLRKAFYCDRLPMVCNTICVCEKNKLDCCV